MRRAPLFGAGALVALAAGWVMAASPVVTETVAIVDPSTPSQQAGVDPGGNLKVNCIAGCSAASATGADNTDGVAAVSTGLGTTVGYGYVWNGASWDRQAGSAANGTMVNVAKIGGGTLALGQASMAASLPVAIASNQGNVPVAAAPGSNIIGKVGIDQTTPGTSNGVSITAALPTGSNVIGAVNPAAATSGGASITSTQVANNTTAVVIKASAGTVYGVEAFNNSATIAYIKLYNATSATCGLGTPAWRGMIPANASGAGFISPAGAVGDAYATGITMCVTAGYADSDTTAPATSTYIVNVRYK